MNKVFTLIFIFLSANIYAQTKTDVLVLGGSMAGTAAAYQAAQSGVNTILIESGEFLISDELPNLDIKAFETGIWKEWLNDVKIDRDSFQFDSRKTLEKLLVQHSNIVYYNKTTVESIKEEKSFWEVAIKRNNKIELIKATVLIDASLKQSPLLNNNIFNLQSPFVPLNAIYSDIDKPYGQKNYRVSGSVGYTPSSNLKYFPLGNFIAKNKANLLVLAPEILTEYKENNLATWANIGQMAGAVAAYAPFFNVTVDKLNIRLVQAEILKFNAIIYPVLDVAVKDSAFLSVQKIIATGLLKFDFKNGLFNPSKEVSVPEFKEILSEMYPRSRIWFIENKSVENLSLKKLISLISFITGKEEYNLEEELKKKWKSVYGFNSPYNQDAIISKLEFAVIIDQHLNPFINKVSFEGVFIR